MKKFKSILCVVDPEENSETAIVQSIKIAKDHQADITFLSVVETTGSWLEVHLNKDERSRELSKLVEKRRSAVESTISAITPSLDPKIEIYSGIGFIQIIKHVVNNQHDLLVKCAETTDWLHRIFGSKDMHLLRKCPCPVLMLKPGEHVNFRNILATVDVNRESNELDEGRVQHQLNSEVLKYSAALCMPELACLHVGCAWQAYGESSLREGAFSRQPAGEVDEYVEQIRSECGARLDALIGEMDNILGKDAVEHLLPNVHLVKGAAPREIPQLVEKHDIDLIVMGTVGRVGIPGLIIGNTAESILEQVKCSVLAIKPEGFKTPVG